MSNFPSTHLIIATLIVVFGSSYQLGYTFSWTNSVQPVMLTFIRNSFSATYGYNLTIEGESLLWSAIVSTKTLGHVIGAEFGRCNFICNFICPHQICEF